jgi:hypothetical protein
MSSEAGLEKGGGGEEEEAKKKKSWVLRQGECLSFS